MKYHLLAPLAAAAVATASLLSTGIPAASAEPAATDQAVIHEGATPDITPEWREGLEKTPNMKEMWAYSPSMNRKIPLAVITPKDTSVPRPTLYLLNGGDGGEGSANWLAQTDVAQFYADKNVNVVIPMEGKFSYYTDWVQPDQPQLGGKQLWETFLTKELPAPLEKSLGASTERGIIGMSMSGTSSLLLAEHNPDLYQAVGSFSGCAATNDPVSDSFLRVTLDRGNANPDAMWGPVGSETRANNDALLHAEALKGHSLYISNSSGTAGFPDMPSNPRFGGNSIAAANVQILGGAIEAGTNWCTHQLQAKLNHAGIPAVFNIRNTGTHQWSYWQQDLRDSWPTFANAWKTDD